MGISVIIPTCNRKSIVLKTISIALENLAKITSNYEILVINDGQDEILFEHPSVKIFKNIKKGVASARNYGVSLSAYDHLLFLDDDILLTFDAINCFMDFFTNPEKSKMYCLNVHWKFPEELIKQCQRNNFGRFLIHINYIDMKGWMKGQTWKNNDEFIVPHLASYGLALTKENFIYVGGYNEIYPFSGFEDYDFSMRVHQSGMKVLLNTKVCMYHNEEDRVFPENWLQRRYREGATRAVYVKLTHDPSMIIQPSFIKKVVFYIIYNLHRFLIFITRRLNISVKFDRISFILFNALAGAYIWKGYAEYTKKN